MKKDYKIILENEQVEELVYSKPVEQMTEEEKRIAEMYVDAMLEEVDDFINDYLNHQFFILLYYITMTTNIIKADSLSVSKYFTFKNQNYYADLSDVF